MTRFLTRTTIVVSFCLLGVLSACKKMVEVKAPVTQLVTETVFKNDASAVAAQLAIYAQMEADGLPYNMAVATGLSADECINYSPSPDYTELYTNGLTSVNAATNALWTSFYKYVYEANAVLEGIVQAATLSAGVKKQLEGEAKFVRAFCHFYLVNLFGAVPVLASTDFRVNAVSGRQPASQVYQAIIQDLKEAALLLGDNYVSGANIPTTERTRPNKWAAIALLARAYLYNKNWPEAETAATAVIGQSAHYGLVPRLNEVFLKNSPEAIWQLMPVIPGYNSIEGASFILKTTPSLVSLTPDLVNSFEPGDGRKGAWIDSMTVAGTTYRFPYKYKVYQNAAALTEYSMLQRLAEIYLVRAEARSRQGKLPEAQNDLNAIRNRAGLPNTTAANPADIMDAILQERRVELFTEMGHRWLDLKHMEKTGLLQAKGTGWREQASLYPIPQAELNLNPNLTQNPGY